MVTVNDEIRGLRQTCRQAERKWEKNKLQMNYDIFKEALKKFQRYVKTAKSKYFVELIENNANNPKTLFNIINSVVNPPKLNVDLSPSICENFLDIFLIHWES